MILWRFYRVVLWQSLAVESERFDELVAKLRRELLECIELLQLVGEEHWASSLQGTVARLDAYDPEAFQHALGAFGGMGSFNDLSLHPTNGHEIGDSEIDVTNEKLKGLRSSIYKTSKKLRRELDRR